LAHPVSGKVIALSPSLEDRDQNTVGLKADIDLLMHPCGVDVPIIEDGGITFQEVYTVLVPVSKDEKKLFSGTSCTLTLRKDVWKLREDLWTAHRPSTWFKTRDIQELQDGHHFMGWCPHTLITLGTPQLATKTWRFQEPMSEQPK
jgi:hypothetical protein